MATEIPTAWPTKGSLDTAPFPGTDPENHAEVFTPI